MRCPTLTACVLLAAGLAGGVLCGPVRGDDLPEDAARLVAAFDEDAEAIRQQAEEKIAKQRKELAAKLKELQDQYCKAAKLDEAVAIRDKIRSLGEGNLPVQADPGSMSALGAQTGARFHFVVTGTTTGYAYGTDVYTTDSTIATAAVHSGALKNGETGVVRVTVLPGRNNYLSSTRNGITTSAWNSYPASYSVERMPHVAVPAVAPPPVPGLGPQPFGPGGAGPGGFGPAGAAPRPFGAAGAVPGAGARRLVEIPIFEPAPKRDVEPSPKPFEEPKPKE